MIELDLEVSLTVSGPFLSQSSAMGGFGVDAVALRDRNGFPLLPGSQVRGRIREALLELFPANGPSLVNEHLGSEADRDDIDHYTLRRWPWFFGDFANAQPEYRQTSPYDGLLTRISINELTGAAKSGALLIAECAVPPGKEAVFSGLVTLTARDADDAREQLKQFKAAVRWVPSVGSFRSVGFGRVLSVAVEVKQERHWTSSAISTDAIAVKIQDGVKRPGLLTPSPARNSATRLLTVTMEAPFCVGGRRRDRNVYRSMTHLPGAVLKGAVAQLVRQIVGTNVGECLSTAGSSTSWGHLCDKFSDLRFLAAFPSRRDSTRRPMAVPLSFIKGDTDEVRDAASIDRPFLLKSREDGSRLIAPAFSIDWKSTTTKDWDSGRVEPMRELRLHTAIDSRRRRAKDEHLFGHELIHSKTKDGEEIVFQGGVSLPPLSNPNDHDEHARQMKVWDELEALFEIAVFRIGKTKARARFRLSDIKTNSDWTSDTTPTSRNRWLIVLQSPALIVDPQEVHDAWNGGVDCSEEAYGNYFATVSKQSIKLVNQFRDESLHGGFLAYRSNPRDYEPFLVTEPGTVFVLEATDPGNIKAAQDHIQSWLNQGLPLPEWAIKKHGSHFKSNPFLPQDGFGEIVVNVPAQLQLAVKEGEVELL